MSKWVTEKHFVSWLNLCPNNHWLGDYFRRMKAKGGNKYAIVATANKIATIYYKMISETIAFNPPDFTEYQEKRNNDKIAYLERTLKSLKKDSA